MVTHSCHQVKLICVRRPGKPRFTTRLVDPWGLLRCYSARSGRLSKTSFKDPSREAGKEVHVLLTETDDRDAVVLDRREGA